MRRRLRVGERAVDRVHLQPRRPILHKQQERNHLIVYAPYRSLEGFIEDLEDFCRAGNGAVQRLKELHHIAITQVDKMMLTDAPLLYTPGQLALAALHKSNDVHKVLNNFDRYLERAIEKGGSACPVGQFIKSLNEINCLVDQLKIPTVKDMRHIDRKLKHCLDPSSHDEHKKKEKKSKHKSKRTTLNS
ncbi:hypothetical protein QOZ80_3BG0262390 [Eleusine coracana subsp. coracana]|nr:hypothetical protein QOZ80_3BG0262390 [Eleusine coracana subsp. coracana]